MRFLALMKKELRECLPWILAAGIFLLVFGGFGLWTQTIAQYSGQRYRVFSPGSDIYGHELTEYPVSHSIGTLLFLTSIGLGIALGIRQFWVAGFIKTWGFTLHRSVSRGTVLLSKLAVTAVGFVVSTGIVWIALYLYTCRPGFFAVPPTIRTFLEGWIIIAAGFVVYLGTVLVGLSTTRWYTTKKFGLVFAIFVIVMTFWELRLGYAFAAMIAGAIILLLQITDTFLKREF